VIYDGPQGQFTFPDNAGVMAVDLGASSGRFAAGRILPDGDLDWQLIEQMPHSPKTWNGQAVWDLDSLLELCNRAAEYGSSHFSICGLGIDSWGVDHGFIDANGKLIQPIVCYRDPSHLVQFDQMKAHRHELFQLTGIAHQPFNTIYQLLARKEENPELPKQGKWLLLPDLLGKMLGASSFYEITNSSTTQLMGVDGEWSEELLELIGWPFPESPPTCPAWNGSQLSNFSNVVLSHVGSHDTASAVAGFGELGADEMYLNLGTWILAGVVVDTPILSQAAEVSGFSNEWGYDRKIRFLKNIPGFYVLNRIYDEIQSSLGFATWLDQADKDTESVDFMDNELYNPPSMIETVSKLIGKTIKTDQHWAGIALNSMAKTVTNQIPILENILNRKLKRIVIGGGGGKSERVCQAIAETSGLEIRNGPNEATVLGNLRVGCLACLKDERFYGAI